jgi:hypothetical protein
VERFHRQLKDALRARLQGQDWVSQLPWILMRGKREEVQGKRDVRGRDEREEVRRMNEMKNCN